MSFLILNHSFKGEKVNISIKIEDIILSIILFFSFILFYLNPIGLYSDEIAYATSAFQLSIFIVDKFGHIFDLLTSLNKIPLKYIYQILSLIGWLIILCIIFFIKK